MRIVAVETSNAIIELGQEDVLFRYPHKPIAEINEFTSGINDPRNNYPRAGFVAKDEDGNVIVEIQTSDYIVYYGKDEQFDEQEG